MTQRLRGCDWAAMIEAACRNLEARRQEIDALNVFPVPDGDTGTNMYLTIKAAAEESKKVTTNSVSVVAEAASKGALLGARGNSGVILSQFFRGLAQGLKGVEEAGIKELDLALQQAVVLIYAAVMKPVEGTMLTVARSTAEASAKRGRNTSMEEFLQGLVNAAEHSLARTPELLPVLKDNGVVDAGGRGLVEILRGFCEGMGLSGNEEIILMPPELILSEEESYGEYLYCTEFLLRGKDLDEQVLKEKLCHAGDSLLVVGQQDILKIHVHTNHPGKVLEECLAYGELDNIAIHNMATQARTRQEKLDLKKKDEATDGFAIVTVANGEGLKNIFLNLGVDVVVTGGPTMNPSTEQILNAFKGLTCGEIIIVPNDKNIIPAAQQAAGLSNKRVHVVPSQSIVQGIAAVSVLDKSKDAATNIKKALNAVKGITTVEITLAVKDANIQGLNIKKDDFIAILDGENMESGQSPAEALKKVIPKKMLEGKELVTIYYGQDTDEKQALKLAAEITEIVTGCETQIYEGGQPHYHFLIGLE